MKKFGIFVAALVAAVTFTSCDGNKTNGPDLNQLPNGFYVSEAGVDLIEANAMDQGINEVDQTARTGMYEKYIVLEAGKKYEFVNKKGAVADKYGAALEYGEELIVTDNVNVPGYKGSLAENATVEVTETGLYHIVLDFNEDGNLSDVGGAQCIMVPVKWGVRGAMNGWGFTEGEKTADNTWEWNCTIETAGAFKFAHSNAWKINLDIANLVKANTNLGADCLPGGADIPLERAEYKITLEFVGPAATTQESYKCTVEKTGELEVLDPSTFVYSFIGSITDANWGVDTDFTFVSNEGDHYVFEAKGLDFAAGEFKIRFGHDWAKSFGAEHMTITGAEVSGTEGNITLVNPFKGSAKFEFDWDGSAEKNIKLTFVAE